MRFRYGAVVLVGLATIIFSASASCGGSKGGSSGSTGGSGGAGGSGGSGGAGTTSGPTSTASSGSTSSTASSSATVGSTGSGGLDCPPTNLTCNTLVALAHCDTSSLVGFCVEYYDACVTGQEIEDSCTRFGGTFADGACPAADKLGYCIDSDLVQSTFAIYAFMGLTEAQAKMQCESDGGVWCSSAP